MKNIKKMSRTMNFTFIGMPGCGKSCMAHAISGKVKMKMVDVDRLIEKEQGKKLQQIIDDVGLEGFKKIEEQTLLSSDWDNILLSPGGSAVYYEEAMKHLKKCGKIIYLYVGLDTLLKRLGDYSQRGVVIKEGQTFEDLYNERCALYEKYADVKINCDGKAYKYYQSQVIKYIKSVLKNK